MSIWDFWGQIFGRKSKVMEFVEAQFVKALREFIAKTRVRAARAEVVYRSQGKEDRLVVYFVRPDGLTAGQLLGLSMFERDLESINSYAEEWKDG